MKFATSFTVFISTLVVAIVSGDDVAPPAIADADIAAAAAASINDIDKNHRDLQCDTTAAWHPDYSNGWSAGKCDYTTTCNSPSYSTNLACCQTAFAGQVSNYCVSQLANPPTLAPTKTGGPDAYYPDYSLPWPTGKCINTVPVPSGYPTYSTMLACCKAAYGGQTSNTCIGALPSPPTTAPTPTAAPTKAGEGTYYPDYSLAWPSGVCISTLPVPSGRPTYSSMLACCKGAYGGQTSGACIAALPNPPTTAPTPTGAPTKAGEGTYYPDYSLAWTAGVCISTLPVPSGRPTYSSMLACCKAAYGGQTSGTCIAALPNPPTTAPTPTGAPTKAGEGTYYADYSLAWSEGVCISTLPVPSGRPTYTSMLACCKAAYGGQTSNKCIAALPNPPTAAPTKVSPDLYYPDYSLAWTAGKCINTLPIPSGRPTYTSELACCKAAYAGQVSNACFADLPNPPTKAPTKTPV